MMVEYGIGSLHMERKIESWSLRLGFHGGSFGSGEGKQGGA